jgi:hypothetical protein
VAAVPSATPHRRSGLRQLIVDCRRDER